jgi:hypothetical protein
MSVSGELLCSFELLKPLDTSALKQHIKKSRNKRQSMLNSPVRKLTAWLTNDTTSQGHIYLNITLTYGFSQLLSTLRVTNLFSLCRVTVAPRLALRSSRSMCPRMTWSTLAWSTNGNKDSSSSAIPHHTGNATARDSDSDLDLESDLDDEEGREKRLKGKRALWESTLPKTTTQLDGKPVTKSEYTFIESDETPTKTYEQRHYERKKNLKNKSRLRQKMPFG